MPDLPENSASAFDAARQAFLEAWREFCAGDDPWGTLETELNATRSAMRQIAVIAYRGGK